MFRLIAVAIFFGGVAVNAQSCMTSTNNATFDTYITTIDDALPVLSNPPTDQQLADTFSEFCNNTDVIAAVDATLDLITNVCHEYETLALTKEIGTVQLGQLLTAFDDGLHFCSCVTEFVTALTFEPTDYHRTEVAGQYTTVGDFPAMCDSTPFKTALTTLYDNQQCRSNALTFSAGGITTDNIGTLDQTFDPSASYCGSDQQVDFDCAMTESAGTEFKTCITAASTACQREDCVNMHMNCTTEAKVIYMVMVTYIDDTAFIPNCDSAATSTTMSVLLIVSAAMYSMFL